MSGVGISVCESQCFLYWSQLPCSMLRQSLWTWLACHSNKPPAVNIYLCLLQCGDFSLRAPTPVSLLSRPTASKRETTSSLWVTRTASGWAWARWWGCWRTSTRRVSTSRWSAWWTASPQWYVEDKEEGTTRSPVLGIVFLVHKVPTSAWNPW